MTFGLINCSRKSCTFRTDIYCNALLSSFFLYFVLSLEFASIMALTKTTCSSIRIVNTKHAGGGIYRADREIDSTRMRERGVRWQNEIISGNCRVWENGCRNCTKGRIQCTVQCVSSKLARTYLQSNFLCAHNPFSVRWSNQFATFLYRNGIKLLASAQKLFQHLK